jgi:hypothetical protein
MSSLYLNNPRQQTNKQKKDNLSVNFKNRGNLNSNPNQNQALSRSHSKSKSITYEYVII